MWPCTPGTLLAVILYFFKDWLTLLVCGLGGKYPATAPAEEVLQHRRMFCTWSSAPSREPFSANFSIRQIEEHLRTPVIIGISLILVALIMWWADSRATQARKLEAVKLRRRHCNRYGSGRRSLARRFAFRITITAGLFRNFTREAATRFSFLLSAPIIAGAVCDQNSPA